MLRKKLYCSNKITINIIILGMLALAGIPTALFGYIWEQHDVYTCDADGEIIYSPAQPGRFLFGNRGITDDAGETARAISLPPVTHPGYYQFDKVNPDGLFRIDSGEIPGHPYFVWLYVEYTPDLGSTWVDIYSFTDSTSTIWDAPEIKIKQSPVDPDLIYMVDPPIDMGYIGWEAPFLRSRDHGLSWDTLTYTTYWVPLGVAIYDIIPSPIDTNTAIFILKEDYYSDSTVFRLSHDAGESFGTFSVDSISWSSDEPIFIPHPSEPESLFGFIFKPRASYRFMAFASGDTLFSGYDSVELAMTFLGPQFIAPFWDEGRFGLYYAYENNPDGDLSDTLMKFIWPDILDYKPIDMPTFHKANALSLHPNHPDTIIAYQNYADWPGVIRTTDGGENWFTCETGQNGALTSIFASKHDPQVVYATSYQAALYKSSDYGATWDTVFGDWPDNPRYNGRTNVFNTMFESPLNPETMLIPMYSGADVNIQIARSDDGGEHWIDGDSGICDTLYFNGITAFHSHVCDDSLWFAGFGGTMPTTPGIVRSTDAGLSWQHQIEPWPYLPVTAFAISSSYKDSNVIYAGGRTGLSISTDYGLTWTQTCYHSDSLGITYPNAACNSLFSITSPYSYTFASVDLGQIDGSIRPFFVRTYDHVHWDTLETVRDSFKVKCMASDPTHPATRIFAAGTHWFSGEGFHTVIESNDGGDTWQDIGPSVPFLDDDLNYFGDGMILTQDNLSVSLDGRYLYLATTKKGIYRCELPPMGISEDNSATKPEIIDLEIWPNPFNSAVSISSPEKAIVEIFNINGRCLAEFDGEVQIWKPEPSVGSGIYLVRATVGEQEVTKRIVYLK